MDHIHIPNWALVNWRQPGLQARVWVYHVNRLQTIAQPHELEPGSIITYDGDITNGLNLTQGPQINDGTWQWLTKDSGGPFKRKEGYMYLEKLYQGQTMNELMTLFEESNTGSDTEGLASDGEGKQGVALSDKLNIKF